MTPLRAYIVGGALAVLVGLGGYLYLRGAADQRETDALRDATDYRKTRERIDDANAIDRDPSVILERLRGHSQR